MPTNFRRAELALREARTYLEAVGRAEQWRPTELALAHNRVLHALDLLASADLDECRKWMDEEQCAACGGDATTMTDDAPYCARCLERITQRERRWDAERDDL